MSNIESLDKDLKSFRMLWLKSILTSVIDIMEREKKEE